MTRILIVDDVAAMREQYAYDLERLGGYETEAAPGGTEALRALKIEPADCVLLDLEMPEMDGFAVMEEMKRRGFTMPVIVYTGTGNFERCTRAVKLGATSFLDKSESMEKVVQEIENALDRTRLASEVRVLKRRLGETRGLLGKSKPMKALRREIARVAPVPSTVVILGESGTGKELVAREIHAQSGREKKTFLAVNCAAIPENLVESELFGHERGAFTGADTARKGAFEAAHQGTLFLDEIGELPLAAQAKLLRVLESSELMRVGGTRPFRVDTRVVSATNRDLEAEVEAGRFRKDLWFRINVHLIRVPPLRERLDDVPLLVDHFLETMASGFGMPVKTMSAEALSRLRSYDWRRNNVRELRNIVERMILAAEGPEISPDAVPSEVSGPRPVVAVDETPGKTLKELKVEAERTFLLSALERNGWQIGKTAAELGLADHASLLKIMRRHGIKRG